MKRRIQAFIFAAFMLMLAGCSSNQKAGDGSGSGTAPATTQKVEEEVHAKTVSLDVENDLFTFDALSQQIGAKEADVIQFLRAKEKGSTYSAKLFGEAVTISLETEEEVVRAIQLVFADTDPELLKNAISEQLGQDGETNDQKTEWKDESGVTTLSSGADGCVVEITK